MRLKSKRMCGYKFRRQYSADRYILDFYCPKLKLAIEVDGISHESQKQRDYDYKRQFYIEGFGITFIRISDEEILSNLDTVVKKIKFHINEIENFFRKTSPIPLLVKEGDGGGYGVL